MAKNNTSKKNIKSKSKSNFSFSSKGLLVVVALIAIFGTTYIYVSHALRSTGDGSGSDSGFKSTSSSNRPTGSVLVDLTTGRVYGVPSGYQILITDCYKTIMRNGFTAIPSAVTSTTGGTIDCFRKYQFKLSDANSPDTYINVEGFNRATTATTDFNQYVQKFIDQSRSQGNQITDLNTGYKFHGKSAIRYIIKGNDGSEELVIWVDKSQDVGGKTFDTFLIKAAPYNDSRLGNRVIDQILSVWIWR